MPHCPVLMPCTTVITSSYFSFICLLIVFLSLPAPDTQSSKLFEGRHLAALLSAASSPLE